MVISFPRNARKYFRNFVSLTIGSFAVVSLNSCSNPRVNQTASQMNNILKNNPDQISKPVKVNYYEIYRQGKTLNPQDLSTKLQTDVVMQNDILTILSQKCKVDYSELYNLDLRNIDKSPIEFVLAKQGTKGMIPGDIYVVASCFPVLQTRYLPEANAPLSKATTSDQGANIFIKQKGKIDEAGAKNVCKQRGLGYKMYSQSDQFNLIICEPPPPKFITADTNQTNATSIGSSSRRSDSKRASCISQSTTGDPTTNLRETPNISSSKNILTRIPNSTKLEIIEMQNKGGKSFYKVKFGSKIGFIAASQCKSISPKSASPFIPQNNLNNLHNLNRITSSSKDIKLLVKLSNSSLIVQVDGQNIYETAIGYNKQYTDKLVSKHPYNIVDIAQNINLRPPSLPGQSYRTSAWIGFGFDLYGLHGTTSKKAAREFESLRANGKHINSLGCITIGSDAATYLANQLEIAKAANKKIIIEK